MTVLRSPLKAHAPYPVDGATTQRVWRGVVARLETKHARGARRQMVVWFACGALAGAAFILAIEHRPNPAPQIAVNPGPLTLSNGGALATLQTPDVSGETALADGSVLALAPKTRLEPLENTATSLVLLLAEGRATFDVRPGGPRRWTIECGLATVEVVGTRFVVERASDRLRVVVERGTVLVRGERVPSRVQRLTAGTQLEILGVVPSASNAVAATASSTPPASVAPANAAHGWQELARLGAYSDAYRALEARGLGAEVTRSTSAQDLMALADVARLSGHAEEAVAPLRRIIDEHLDDASAPLAAFTLGKIRLNSLGRPKEAARDFEQAIDLGLPSGLLEDAYVYLVDARTKSGDGEGARVAAFAYQKRFPASERAASLVKSVSP